METPSENADKVEDGISGDKKPKIKMTFFTWKLDMDTALVKALKKLFKKEK